MSDPRIIPDGEAPKAESTEPEAPSHADVDPEEAAHYADLDPEAVVDEPLEGDEDVVLEDDDF